MNGKICDFVCTFVKTAGGIGMKFGTGVGYGLV